MRTKHFLITLISFLLTGSLPGQGLLFSYSTHDTLTICGTQRLDLILENTGAAVISDIRITMQCPQGISYLPGSVTNAEEININQPDRPVFRVASVAPASRYVFSITLECGCEAFEKANMAQRFENMFWIAYNNRIDSLRSSPPFPVYTPFVILADVPDVTVPIGTLGSRTIKITNTRLGDLHRLNVEDHHGLAKITASLGQTIVQNDTVLILTLGPSDFVQFGDHDSIFERDEMIVLEEHIEALGCNAYAVPSWVRAAWGCGGSFCQESGEGSVLTFEQNPVEAMLNLSANANVPVCACDTAGAVQELIIRNSGQGIADHICITLHARDPFIIDPIGFRKGSLMVTGPRQPDSLQYIGLISGCAPASGDSLYEQIRLCWATLYPGEEIQIRATWLSCLSSLDSSRQLRWSYDYEYGTRCNPTSLRMNTDQKVNIPPVNLPVVTVGTQFPSDVYDNTVNTLQANFAFSKNPTTEKMNVDILIPCPMRFQDSLFLLGGQKPLTAVITPQPGGGYLANLTYRAPFGASPVSLQTKIAVDCDDPCADHFPQSRRTRAITNCPIPRVISENLVGVICVASTLGCPDDRGDCGSRSVANQGAGIICDSTVTRQDTIPGYIDFTAEGQRISLGERDYDNDRMPEAGALDTALIDRQVFITGDSLQFTFRGRVVTDRPDRTLDSMAFFVSTLVTMDNGSSDLTYYSKSLQRYFSLEQLPVKEFKLGGGSPKCGETELSGSGLGRGYMLRLTPEDIHAMHPDFPSDYRFGDGDSILVRMRGRVISTVNDRLATLPFFYYAFVYDRRGHFVTPFVCGNASQQMRQATNSVRFDAASSSALLCGTTVVLPAVYMYGSRHLHNLFPYEFRSLHRITALNYFISPVLRMDSVKIKYYYTLNGNRYLKDSVILPLSFSSVWQVDSARLASLRHDESYEMEIIGYASLPDCRTALTSKTLSAALTVQVGKDFDADFHVDPDYRNLLSEYTFSRAFSISNYIGGERLQLATPVIVSSSKLLQWKANVTDLKQTGYYLVHFSSRLGMIDSFVIKPDPSFDTLISRGSSDYILGKFIPGKNYAINFCARNRTCTTDTIIMDVIWSCGDQYREGDTCSVYTFRIPVVSEPPELELKLTQDNLASSLCDTLPEILLELFNAGEGAAYRTTLEIDIPQGITLLPSELRIAYPSNASFVTLPPPVWIGGTTYRWDFEHILPSLSATGLPGYNSAPANGMKIRLKALTACQSSVNGYFNFVFRGERNCDLRSNAVSKSSNLIRIQGVSNPPPLNVIFRSDSTGRCPDSHRFTVEIRDPGISSGLDTVSILIPSGIVLAPNSYVAVSNAATAPILRSDSRGTFLLVPLLPGLAAGSIIRFEFTLMNFNHSGCTALIIPLEIFRNERVFCAQTQMDCSAMVTRYHESVRFDYQFMQLALDSMKITTEASETYFDLWLNIRDFAHRADSTICVGLYNDFTTHGLLDSTDRLIEQYMMSDRDIQGDGQYHVRWKVDRNKIFSCRFGAAVLAKSCICLRDTVFDAWTTRDSVTRMDSVCSGIKKSFGIPTQDRHFYRWARGSFPCNECAANTLQWSIASGRDSLIYFQLTDSSEEGCVTDYLFTVLLTSDQGYKLTDTICRGREVVFSAGTRPQFKWSGFLTNPFANEQRLKFNEDSMVLLEYRGPHGCTVTDTFCVRVSKALDQIKISRDTVIDPGGTATLEVSPGYAYRWYPGVDLDCTNCPVVHASPDTSTRYYVEVTDSLGCTRLLTVKVSLLQAPCDSSTFFIPNAFSPNDDHANDVFYVRAASTMEIHLEVYDRWGEKVFQSDDLNYGWDGRFRGIHLPPDVYGYYCTLRCPDGRSYFKKGNVTLLK